MDVFVRKLRRRKKGRSHLTRRRRGRSWVGAIVALLAVVVTVGLSCRHGSRPRQLPPSSGEGRSASRPKTARKPAPVVEQTPDREVSSSIVQLPPCLHGCPVSSRAPKGRLIEREGWVLFNDPRTKFSDWVAYRVSPSTIGRSKAREWKADPDLPPEETLEPEDYRGAHARLHTDRGHQVPLASFSGVRKYEPLNYMSNVTPQQSVLNQKLWNILEQKERELVLSRNLPLYVVTGPLYERKMDSLPGADEPHVVPSGYFKVLAAVLDGELETAAIFADQTETGEDFCALEVAIDEVERRAQLELFGLLPEQKQRELESVQGKLFSRFGCD